MREMQRQETRSGPCVVGEACSICDSLLDTPRKCYQHIRSERRKNLEYWYCLLQLKFCGVHGTR